MIKTKHIFHRIKIGIITVLIFAFPWISHLSDVYYESFILSDNFPLLIVTIGSVILLLAYNYFIFEDTILTLKDEQLKLRYVTLFLQEQSSRTFDIHDIKGIEYESIDYKEFNTKNLSDAQHYYPKAFQNNVLCLHLSTGGFHKTMFHGSKKELWEMMDIIRKNK